MAKKEKKYYYQTVKFVKSKGNYKRIGKPKLMSQDAIDFYLKNPEKATDFEIYEVTSDLTANQARESIGEYIVNRKGDKVKLALDKGKKIIKRAKGSLIDYRDIEHLHKDFSRVSSIVVVSDGKNEYNYDPYVKKLRKRTGYARESMETYDIKEISEKSKLKVKVFDKVLSPNGNVYVKGRLIEEFEV